MRGSPGCFASPPFGGFALVAPSGGRILPIELASQTATCGAVCGAFGLLQVDEILDAESLCLSDRFFSVRHSASRLVAPRYEASTSLAHECPIGHFAIMTLSQSTTASCVVLRW